MSENVFVCTGCGARFRLLKDVQGRTLACKKCGAPLEPAPPREEVQHAAPAAAGAHPAAHRPRQRQEARMTRKDVGFGVLCAVVLIGGLWALISLLPSTRAPEFRQTSEH